MPLKLRHKPAYKILRASSSFRARLTKSIKDSLLRNMNITRRKSSKRLSYGICHPSTFAKKPKFLLSSDMMLEL